MDPDLVDVARAVLEAVIPADEDPSALTSGGAFLDWSSTDSRLAPLVVDLLTRISREVAARDPARAITTWTAAERDALFLDLERGDTATEWADAADDWASLVRLVSAGYYANPEYGGNAGARSWSMVGYRPLPIGAQWPNREPLPPTIGLDDVDGSVDALIVGSGAGGGIVAEVLSEAGWRTLVVERGSHLEDAELGHDHLRNQRTFNGLEKRAGPPVAGNPRVVVGDSTRTVTPDEPEWSNTAMTVGGGTRVYGGQAWRFSPLDFRMRSAYGRPAGGALEDWPIDYDELEPFYDSVEWELGVAGDGRLRANDGHRRRGYPMRPFAPGRAAVVLADGARRLGLEVGAVPLLVNTEPYGGRPACVRCGTCVGFACLADARAGTHNTSLGRAVRSGRCSIATDTVATSLETDGRGRVIGARLRATADSDGPGRVVLARVVVLAAGAIETPRLLLASTSVREPRGIGNDRDLVGRFLQGHAYAGAVGLFEEPVQDGLGPGPSIATTVYRHSNDGVVGGGILADEFVPTPLETWQTLTTAGLIPTWGIDAKAGMRRLYRRSLVVVGPVHETPVASSRVRLDPLVVDGLGLPVARLEGHPHPGDDKAAELLVERSVAWLRASGATAAVPVRRGAVEGPSAGTHQAGTCRMGRSRASSVTDRWGRIWGHPELLVADASTHVTNGTANPVLTTMANAMRVARRLVDDG